MGMSAAAAGVQAARGGVEAFADALKALGRRIQPGVHKQAQLHGLGFVLFRLEAAENQNNTG